MRARFLFTTWSGGGNVPPVLSVARTLRARGHDVRVMADPSLAGEIQAAGLEPVGWTTAPTGVAASAAGAIVRDHEARTPIGAVARARDRLICGAAGAYAHDTLAELRRSPADVLAADCMLLGCARGRRGGGCARRLARAPDLSVRDRGGAALRPRTCRRLAGRSARLGTASWPHW